MDERSTTKQKGDNFSQILECHWDRGVGDYGLQSKASPNFVERLFLISLSLLGSPTGLEIFGSIFAACLSSLTKSGDFQIGPPFPGLLRTPYDDECRTEIHAKHVVSTSVLDLVSKTSFNSKRRNRRYARNMEQELRVTVRKALLVLWTRRTCPRKRMTRPSARVVCEELSTRGLLFRGSERIVVRARKFEPWLPNAATLKTTHLPQLRPVAAPAAATEDVVAAFQTRLASLPNEAAEKFSSDDVTAKSGENIKDISGGKEGLFLVEIAIGRRPGERRLIGIGRSSGDGTPGHYFYKKRPSFSRTYFLKCVEFCAGITVTGVEPGVFVAHVPQMKWTGSALAHKSYSCDLHLVPILYPISKIKSNQSQRRAASGLVRRRWMCSRAEQDLERHFNARNRRGAEEGLTRHRSSRDFTDLDEAGYPVGTTDIMIREDKEA
ncbi:hypothetical protein C8J56DRAFT_890953 [Mycena floridula]|nr:hypothetical protein C8J56DRAFT_890953 [Mycena floridula]